MEEIGRTGNEFQPGALAILLALHGGVLSAGQQSVPEQDWPNLAAYREANAKFAPPAAGEARVVFLGDSITYAWSRAGRAFFPGKPYINRGLKGQTTPQMLVRFFCLGPTSSPACYGRPGPTRGPGTTCAEPAFASPACWRRAAIGNCLR